MNDQSVKLIDILVTKTQNKEVNWEKTSKPEEYKLQFENGSALTISKINNDMASFQLYNEKGVRIDGGNFGGGGFVKKIIELVNLIGKIERKEDETYKDIFDELTSKKIIGKNDAPNN